MQGMIIAEIVGVASAVTIAIIGVIVYFLNKKKAKNTTDQNEAQQGIEENIDEKKENKKNTKK